jgi:hypothetical protein
MDNPAICWQFDDTKPRLFSPGLVKYLCRGVAGTVVYDDDLEDLERLRKNAEKSMLKPFARVEARYYD